MKIRTIITQDAEVDDQNSLRHFLLYSNEVELLGIVQTSSKYHWEGVPGVVKKQMSLTTQYPGEEVPGDFSKPYRWPGTDWMFRVIDDYEKDYPNLLRCADGYPTPAYLRSITKVGNIGYMGEVEAASEGSELIRKAILADDERKLYIQIWGGCNTVTRALMDIEAEFKQTELWSQIHEDISKKVVLTACGEQDETYRSYIAEEWPQIQFVKTLQMGSYAYIWPQMPEGESKETLKSHFMQQYILNSKSALMSRYCTWLDGNHYEGEEKESQFGSNPNISNEWFGSHFGLKSGEKYDFLSEGDSPTFLLLLNWGFRTLENFAFGGIAGRYVLCDETNSKGEKLNIWNVVQDAYTDTNGNTVQTESMWQYVADIQRDFAARVEWAANGQGEHAPCITVCEGLDLEVRAGNSLSLHSEIVLRNADDFCVSYRIYAELSAPWASEISLETSGCSTEIQIPETAVAGDKLHIIVKAQANSNHRLVHYRHVIISVI